MTKYNHIVDINIHLGLPKKQLWTAEQYKRFRPNIDKLFTEIYQNWPSVRITESMVIDRG